MFKSIKQKMMSSRILIKKTGKLLKIIICLILTIQASAQVDESLWRTYNNPAPGVTFEDLQTSFNTYWKDREYQKGKGYKQFKRWENQTKYRVYPSGNLTLPSMKYENYKTWEVASNIKATNNKSIGPVWTELGPFGRVTGFDSGNGRLNMLRVHPTDTLTLYAGAADGGLWKSTDYGATWSSNTDFLAAIGVADLAINPVNTNIMYLATGDVEGDRRSIGVLKSTDGGNSWNPTGLVWSASINQKTTKLLMDPNDPLKMHLASNAGIFRTTDGWATFTQVAPLVPIKDLEYKPEDTDIIYASTETSFYKSTNNGVSFVESATGLPNSNVVRVVIAVSANNPAVVYALCGKESDSGFLGLYRSSNSGASFTEQSTTPNILGFNVDGMDVGGQAFYDLALTASPANANLVTVGGINQWQSTDGGVNWSIISHWIGDGGKPYMHADVHEIVHLSANSSTMYSSCDGGLYRSKNSGSTWQDITGNMAISQQNTVGISTLTANRIVCGLQDIGTIETGNSVHPDSLWNLAKGGGGDGEDCFIDRGDDNYIVVTGTNGTHELSTNGGLSFSSISVGLPQGAFFSAIRQHPILGDTYLVGGRGDFYRSNNNGTSWIKLGEPFGGDIITEFTVAKSDTSIVFATSGTALAKSTNGGATWSNITGTLPTGSAMITKIAFSDTDANKVWVTFSGYSAGNKVFKSINGGTTWANISSGLPNIPINTIVYENGTAADNIYIGADYGVFFINNMVSSWIPHSNNLPNAQVKDLRIFYGTTPNKIRAATYGRGAWEVDVMTAPCNMTIAEVCNTGPCLFASGLHQAENTISYDGLTGNFVIRNDANVILSAGTSTDLIKNFQVDSGSILEINTTGCMN